MRTAVMAVALALAVSCSQVLACRGEGHHRRRHRRRLHEVRTAAGSLPVHCHQLLAKEHHAGRWHCAHGPALISLYEQVAAVAPPPALPPLLRSLFHQTGKVYSGFVARWADGDTITLDEGTKIRFHGIDAPESAQTCKDAAGAEYPCGQVSSAALRKLIGDSQVSCEEVRRRWAGAEGCCMHVGRCAAACCTPPRPAPHQRQLGLPLPLHAPSEGRGQVWASCGGMSRCGARRHAGRRERGHGPRGHGSGLQVRSALAQR